MHVLPATSDRAVARWLLICAAMVFIIVVIGGVTRLTESGLSITEWKPVSGVLPPLNAEQWEAEFARYRTTTEYQQLNAGMSLGDFKKIFFWEYLHRLWGRLVGLAFAIPFFLFLARGQLRRSLRPRLWGILLLIGAQGALGWYMVASGLSGRTDVSQYRLVAHLSLALVIYVLLLWSALELLRSQRHSAPPPDDATATRPHGHASASPAPGTTQAPRSASRGRTWALALVALVSLTIVSGAFVAGTNAGRIYNTFPLMGGSWVPPSYLQLSPWFINIFDNPVAVQFNHRILGMVTFVAALLFWARARSLPSTPLTRFGTAGVGIMAIVQFLLGIATLLSAAPISLAAAHQSGAVLLLTAATIALFGFWRESESHAASVRGLTIEPPGEPAAVR